MTHVIGLILAGGRATRMGGADKGLVLFGDEPLALRAYRRLSHQTECVLLSENRSETEYRRVMPKDVVLLRDVRENFQGPLAGLEAAMLSVPEKQRAETVIVMVPCDVPYFPLDLAEKLLAAMKEAGTQAAAAEAGGKIQPACAALSCELLPALQSYLDSDGHRIRFWLESVKAVPVPFPSPVTFMNCNTEEELREAERFA